MTPASASAAAVAEPSRPTIVSFVSPGPHSGRTSLVSNLAWMIASAGHDVLVLDWDTQGSSVREFLAPFLVCEGPVGGFLDEDLSLVLAAAMSVGSGAARRADPPVLRRYVGTGPDARARLDVVRSTSMSSDEESPEDSLAVFLDLQRQLAVAGYDFVLIDGPPTERRATATRNGMFADTVVVCFQPEQDAYESAASLAVDVARRSPVRMKIISVPSFFDVSDPTRARDADAEIRSVLLRVFRAAGTKLDPASLVQVPVPLYSLPNGLVAIAYEVADRLPLRRAYEQLLAAVTGGVVQRLPAAPRLTRELYVRGRAAAETPAPGPTTEISYRPADRPWADWVHGQLGAIGVPAVLRRFDGALPDPSGPRVVVLSRHSCAAVAAGGQPAEETVLLKVDDIGDQDPPSRAQVVDVADCSSADSRRRLRAALASSGDLRDRRGSTVPFPGRTPAQWSVAPLDPGLVDRTAELESLRDSLPPGAPARVVLHGAPASGRTELAKAFAHRFGYGYDTVWYVPAGTRPAARASLRCLGDELGVDATGDKATAALRLLRKDAKPYLLIYDDVQSTESIADLLPTTGSGHVIVVRSGAAPADPTGTTIEVGPLSPDDAVQTLRRQLSPTFHFADLSSVVEVIGTGPLTLRLTAGYLNIAAASLEAAGRPNSEEAAAAVREFVARVAAAEPSHRHLVDVGRVLFGLLAGSAEGRLLTSLARMCAFLSPDGVSLRLIRSTSFLDRLIALAGESAGSLVLDTAEIEYTLASGARAALFDVDWGLGRRLRMHRGIQQLTRELMADEEGVAARAATQAALAGYAPNDAQHLARDGREELEELARHLRPSGALEEESSPAVRRWVVVQTAFAALSSDPDEWSEAAAAAEKVLSRQSPLRRDRLGTRLATHYADLLRRLGKNVESLNVDLENLGILHPMLGPAHLRTSISLRGTAGDLRGLGLFAEARIEDVSVYRSFRTLLGPEHPQTLSALHNLALSNFLDGRQEDAVEREDEGFRLREKLLGTDDYTTWWAGLDLGVYLRELGRLPQARDLLDKVVNRLKELLGDEDPLTLRATVALGVTMRRIALAAGASAATGKARGMIGRAASAYEQVLGSQALETQAARMSLATDLAYDGRTLDAVDVAREALEVYEGRLRASHPFVGLCRVDLAALLRRGGRLVEAAEQATGAISILDEAFAGPHPWKLAARINLANIRLCQNECDEAEHLIRTAWDTAEEILPPGHPYLILLRRSVTNIDVWRACATSGKLSVELIDVDVEIPAT